MVKFVLFTTSMAAHGISKELSRFLSSLTRMREEKIDCKLNLLLQGSSPEVTAPFLDSLPHWVEASATDRKMSLSAARNRLLHTSFSSGELNRTTIVGFPDDDCWYLPESLRLIQQTFLKDDQLDFLFCRYSSTPNSNCLPGNFRQPRLQEVISRASSNTIFVRGCLAQNLQNFEEDLGVGASLNGGEDTEYAIRAYLGSRKRLFIDNDLIGHRDINPALRSKYFCGSFSAIRRNCRKNFSVRIALSRKMLVGLWLLLLGDLDLSSFMRAMRG